MLVSWGGRNTDGFAVGTPGSLLAKPRVLDIHTVLAKINGPMADRVKGRPVKIGKVAAGHSHSLVSLEVEGLEEDVVLAMGLNTRGQLGIGTSNDGFAIGITKLQGGKGKVEAISAGRLHSAVVLNSPDNGKKLWTFGDNCFGQCGVGHVGGEFHVPTEAIEAERPEEETRYSEEPFPPLNEKWADVSNVVCGLDHTALLLTRKIRGNRIEGYVATCGWTPDGQLGRPHSDSGSEATLKTIGPLPPFTSVLAAKGDHTIALMGSTGNVWSWGSNEYGQAMYGYPVGGQQQVMSYATPVPVAGFGKFQGRIKGKGHAIGVAAGGKMSLVLCVGDTSTEGGVMRAPNEVWVAGGGVLGLEEREIGKPGMQVKKLRGPWEGLGGATGVFAGLDTGYVVADTRVWAFGGNRNGELGLGRMGPVWIPEEVEMPVEGKVVEIAAGGDFALAVIEVD